MSIAEGSEFDPTGLRVEIPSLRSEELMGLYKEGWQRTGIVAFIADTDGNILFLEHNSTEKTTDGMWGPLGETSKVVFDGKDWLIESPVQTLLRGFTEELGIECSSDDFVASPNVSHFVMSWPIGISHPDENAYAICPIVFIDKPLKDKIIHTQGTEEVKSAIFLAPENIPLLYSLRPGTQDWLHQALSVTEGRQFTDLSHIASPRTANNIFDSSQDAIFRNMYE